MRESWELLWFCFLFFARSSSILSWQVKRGTIRLKRGQPEDHWSGTK
jgi:hypothetical protein